MSTYTPIATQTLGSAAASVTFSSIPQGYTDLILVANTKAGATDNAIFMQFNGDGASNYSTTELRGNGSAAGSARASSQTAIYPSWYIAPGTSNFSHNMILHLINYSNGTTYKTTLSRANNTDVNQGTEATVGLWRSTSAITSIKLYLDATTFSTGSTFSIYGIQVGNAAQKAQGGNIVTFDGTYMYHAFTSSGSFIPSEALTADVLVVAGGGGGGHNTGGGGGAGGYRLLSSQSLTAKSYPVIVGAGGAGGPTTTQTGINGSNSLFGSTISSTGGGGGAGSQTTVDGLGGSSGGSGGGASRGLIAARSGGAGNAGSYSPVEGFAGGNNGSGPAGGGGGGATAVGANATSNGGAGGAGSNSASSWLSATSLGVSGYVAGGGGGGVYGGGSAGAGGSGGGGAGSADSVAAAGNGVTNTGSGGGGANNNGSPSGVAGSGGSGIVIVRYLA